MAEEMKGSTARQLFEAMAQPVDAGSNESQPVVSNVTVTPSVEEGSIESQRVVPPQAVAPSVEEGSIETQPVVPPQAVAPCQEDSIEAIPPSGEVVAPSGDDKR